jgi:hypothetical protein
VLHYNCQKHYFNQRLDHFAAESSGPDPGPDLEGPKSPSDGPGYQSGPNGHHYHEEVRYGTPHEDGNGPHHEYGADDAPDQHGKDHPDLGSDLEHLHDRGRDERKRAKKMKKQAKQINQIKKSVKGHKMEVESTAGVLSFTEDYDYDDDDIDVHTAAIQASTQQQQIKLGPSWKPPSARQPSQQPDRQALSRVSGGAVLRLMPGALAKGSSSSSGSGSSSSSSGSDDATWLKEQQAPPFDRAQELYALKEADLTPEQQALFDAASDALPAWQTQPASRPSNSQQQQALFDAASEALPDAPDADAPGAVSLQHDASLAAWKWGTLYSLVAGTDSAQGKADGQGVEDATDAATGATPAPPGASDAAADAPGGQQQGDVQAGEEKGVFRQVYWVCDAAWPTEPHKQVRTGFLQLQLIQLQVQNKATRHFTLQKGTFLCVQRVRTLLMCQ